MTLKTAVALVIMIFTARYCAVSKDPSDACGFGLNIWIR